MHACRYGGLECDNQAARLHLPAENARNVLCGFALAYLDGVRAQVDGVPSQPEEALHGDTYVSL